MSSKSGIEWTEATWNPVVGCTHVSPGCDGCYAAREASGRLSSHPAYAGLAVDGRFTGQIRTLADRLTKPLQWRKPRRIFVNSMSDLFHRDVPNEFIAEVFAIMTLATQHQFQVLTKRPQRMAQLLADDTWRDEVDGLRMARRPLSAELCDWPRPNIWLGTSIESNRFAWRADHLRASDAAVRFVSAEPLLGPLDELDLAGIDWLIIGGESGPAARPMHVAWVRELRARAEAANVPLFFKQWGEWAPAGTWQGPDHHLTIDGRLYEPGERIGPALLAQPVAIHRWGKRAAGRELDGAIHDGYPA